MLTEAFAGTPMAQPAEPIEKPDALVLTQQMLSTGKLLLEGGLLDQPHIFMREYKICVDLMEVYAALARANKQTSK